MRNCGRKFADIGKPAKARERLPVKPQLDLSAAAGGYKHAKGKSGDRQNQNHCLKSSHILASCREELQAKNPADLKKQNAAIYRFYSTTCRHPDDRQKQNVKELEFLLRKYSKYNDQSCDDGGILSRQFQDR